MSKKKVQVHVPYPVLVKRLDEVIEAGINPEVFISGDTLDGVDSAEFAEVASVLLDNGLRSTVHGPYMDMSPGAADEKVRVVTGERYAHLLEVIVPLKPVAVVLHAGYDAQRFDGDSELWLAQSLKTWPALVKEAERTGTVIALENVYEEDPSTQRMLMAEIASDSLGICLDSGHINIFSKVAMLDWFAVLGSRVAELHIHDNHGRSDEHLPIGDGAIDFPRFFGLIAEYCSDPVYTIEPHGEEVLERGLKAIAEFI
ncbi:MAG: sugar phosphate isomerase/epimerase [Thermodesulfobacteriota bacterium]